MLEASDREYERNYKFVGPNPYYLVVTVAGDRELIDLDETGWATTYADWMRAPGVWMLLPKDGGATLNLTVSDGEQPYYTARHIGMVGSGGSNEVIAYGIGKKLRDGSVMRLWLLNGRAWGGDDVEMAARLDLEVQGPR